MKPMVVIVGRPNVGKSTLLNRLAGRRVAVVEDEPGVTRDRLFVDCRLGERDVLLVDTGGLEQDPGDELARLTVDQARLAVDEADLILFLCDGRDGLHPQDKVVADILRKSGKPFLCLINKCDPGAINRDTTDFHELGLDFTDMSAAHGAGLGEMASLADALLAEAGFPPVADADEDPEEVDFPEPSAEQAETEESTPEVEEEKAPTGPLKLCLLGRPNVGKSSLANRLAGTTRQLVSEIAGTTRDAVDISIDHAGESLLLVDTPGVRRKGRISAKLERYSVVAALRSLERSDVAVVILDGGEAFADQDARLLRLAHDRGRCLVVVVNKTDLWRGDQRRKYLDHLKNGMRFVDYAPVVEVSAVTGKGTGKILPLVCEVFRNAGVRLGTGELNKLIAAALEKQQPPMIKGRRAKIFYVTQAGTHPPKFIAWVNDPNRLSESYRRYLDHQLRARFPFKGVPLKLYFKTRQSNRKRPGGQKKGKRR